MNRRKLLHGLAAMGALAWLPACNRAAPDAMADATPTAAGDADSGAAMGNDAPATTADSGNGSSDGKVSALDRPEGYWRDKVSPAAYAVLFDEDTEPPGSSPLNKEQREGTFVCAACYLPIFESEHKFESGTGWPSFTQPIAGHMDTKADFLLVIPRTEYHCARCGGHQGHVFEDGPPPRGERWCNNGLALRFVPEGEPLPALRG